MNKRELKEILKRTKHIHGHNISKLTKREMEDILYEMEYLHGGNIITDIYERIKAALLGQRSAAPPAIRKFIEENGNNNIVAITVCRDPIVRAVDTILNWISLGTYERNKKSLNYDDVFHLYMYCTLDNGYHFLMEKNHVVNIERSNIGERGDCMSVNMGGRIINVSQFINNGVEVQGPSFWNYNPVTNNCQVFIETLLQSNGLLTPDLHTFIKQCAECLISGPTRKLAEIITDIAGRADILLHGKSLPKRRRRKY